MVSSHLLLEEPIRMASILEPSKTSFFPAMTKIVGTLGPRSRSIEDISGCLKAGMSVARFDFSWGDPEYHQETLENLRVAIKSSRKLCAEKWYYIVGCSRINYQVTRQRGQDENGISLAGFVSWFIWRSAYLTRIISWRNRFYVAMNWTTTLVYGRDNSRIG